MIRTLVHSFFREHLFISVCAVTFFLTGHLLAGGNGHPGPVRLMIVFLSTFIVYRLNASGLTVDAKIRHDLPVRARRFIVWMIAAMLIILSLALLLPPREWIVLTVMGLLSLLYNPPLHHHSRRVSLRAIPLLKIFLIGIVWAMLGSVYPWSVLETSPEWPQALRQFGGLLTFILGITLPFDLRDAEQDQTGGLTTLAHLLNPGTTRTLSVLLLVVSGVLLFPLYRHPVFPIVVLVVSSLLVAGASSGRSAWYFQGLLDGTIPALYLATVLST